MTSLIQVLDRTVVFVSFGLWRFSGGTVPNRRAITAIFRVKVVWVRLVSVTSRFVDSIIFSVVVRVSYVGLVCLGVSASTIGMFVVCSWVSIVTACVLGGWTRCVLRALCPLGVTRGFLTRSFLTFLLGVVRMVLVVVLTILGVLATMAGRTVRAFSFWRVVCMVCRLVGEGLVPISMFLLLPIRRLAGLGTVRRGCVLGWLVFRGWILVMCLCVTWTVRLGCSVFVR